MSGYDSDKENKPPNASQASGSATDANVYLGTEDSVVAAPVREFLETNESSPHNDLDPLSVIPAHESLISNYDTPTQVVDTPTQVVDTPTQVVDTPTQVVDTPTQVVDNPTQVVDIATQVIDNPVRDYFDYNDTSSVIRAHEYLISNDDTPTQVVDTPIHLIDPQLLTTVAPQLNGGQQLGSGAPSVGDHQHADVQLPPATPSTPIRHGMIPPDLSPQELYRHMNTPIFRAHPSGLPDDQSPSIGRHRSQVLAENQPTPVSEAQDSQDFMTLVMSALVSNPPRSRVEASALRAELQSKLGHLRHDLTPAHPDFNIEYSYLVDETIRSGHPRSNGQHPRANRVHHLHSRLSASGYSQDEEVNTYNGEGVYHQGPDGRMAWFRRHENPLFPNGVTVDPDGHARNHAAAMRNPYEGSGELHAFQAGAMNGGPDFNPIDGDLGFNPISRGPGFNPINRGPPHAYGSHMGLPQNDVGTYAQNDSGFDPGPGLNSINLGAPNGYGSQMGPPQNGGGTCAQNDSGFGPGPGFNSINLGAPNGYGSQMGLPQNGGGMYTPGPIAHNFGPGPSSQHMSPSLVASYGYNSPLESPYSDNDELEWESRPDNSGLSYHNPAAKGNWEFLEGSDLLPAEIAHPDPTKFVLFRRHKEDFTKTDCREFPRWRTFDWNDQNDVDALNKGRYQIIARMHGCVGTGSPPWTVLEQTKLYAVVKSWIDAGATQDTLDWDTIAYLLNQSLADTIQPMGTRWACGSTVNVNGAISSGSRKKSTGKLSENRVGGVVRFGAEIRAQCQKFGEIKILIDGTKIAIDGTHVGKKRGRKSKVTDAVDGDGEMEEGKSAKRAKRKSGSVKESGSVKKSASVKKGASVKKSASVKK